MLSPSQLACDPTRSGSENERSTVKWMPGVIFNALTQFDSISASDVIDPSMSWEQTLNSAAHVETSEVCGQPFALLAGSFQTNLRIHKDGEHGK
jgi:hypothetical protein